MEYTVLNGTDLKVSKVCLGGGNFGEKLDREAVFQVLDVYTDGGGNFIDTANVYCRWIPGLANSSEEIIGEWLESRSAKNKVIIATKGAHYDLQAPHVSRVTKADIRQDLTQSMNTLGLDRIDLYWLHRDDQKKPVEEIVDYMEELVKEGSIRYYGASNFSHKRLEEARIYAMKNHLQGFSAVSNMWSAASINPVFNTMRDATMELMEPALYEWHRKTRLPMIPYTSTANGFFEKLYRTGARIEGGRLLTAVADLGLSEHLSKIYLNERNLRLYELLLEIHKETGYSFIALSLAFLISQPFDVVPVGSVTKPEQLNGLLEAGEIKLDTKFKEKFQKFQNFQ
jgi:aryl-alcohol dehydrogenase-like predicted oxidoreductase